MRLAIREYLAGLRESGELDVLLPDLLLSMGIRPLERPMRGVRQYGVDVAAVGQLPGMEDEGDVLALFVIKSGNIGRTDWEGTPQAVRPSLDDVRYEYVRNCIPPEYENLPIVVTLCCGGVIEQTVSQSLTAFKDAYQTDRVRLANWDGDFLSILVEQHMMDEPAFPTISRDRLRRALALVDLNEYTLSDYYTLLSELLPDYAQGLSDRERRHRLRQVNLCLRMLTRWAEQADNLRQPLIAAERTVLLSWDWTRKLGFPATLWSEFGKVYRSYDYVQGQYFAKLWPALQVQDGLFGYGGDRIEYPIRVFEAIGFLALRGFELLARPATSRNRAAVGHVAGGLSALVASNPASKSPCFDDQSIEISLAAYFLYHSGWKDATVSWIQGLSRHIANAVRIGRSYPLSSDSYDELIDMEAGSWSAPDEGMTLSTILPMLADWMLILGMKDERDHLAEIIHDQLGTTTLQQWYPDGTSEEHVYSGNAANKSGTTLVIRELPASRTEATERIAVIRRELPQPAFSCVTNGLPQLLAIAARHFRTPLDPAAHQSLI